MSARPLRSSSRAPRQPPSGTVRTATSDGVVTLVVEGVLDEDAGESLVEALRAALTAGPGRVDIDLAELGSFTDAGLGALNRCREFAPSLPDGLHYRTVPGPGQDAFLSAFE